jgi:hypothetical protein
MSAPTRGRRGCHGSALGRAAWMFALLVWLLLQVAGCATAPDANTVRELHLFGVPVAVNLDQDPDPDGFAVTVYAANGRAASGLPIKKGRLEIALYDGGKVKISPEHQPLRVWTYDSAALKAHVARSSIGWGYRFAPIWETHPTRDRFTVVVRYVAPTGEIIASSPSVISMRLQ